MKKSDIVLVLHGGLMGLVVSGDMFSLKFILPVIISAILIVIYGGLREKGL